MSQTKYDPQKIFKDKWAMKAISYLVRMDYSVEQVNMAMIEVGVRGMKEDENKS